MSGDVRRRRRGDDGGPKPSMVGKSEGARKGQAPAGGGRARKSGYPKNHHHHHPNHHQDKARNVVLMTFLLRLLLLVPMLVLFNPWTIPRLFHVLFRPTCQGICHLDHVDNDSRDGACLPLRSDRVVFVRIPKTASSTVVSLFRLFEVNKSTSVVNLGELEDLVSSIPLAGASPTSRGYHDPAAPAFAERFRTHYRKVAWAILRPPFSNQLRTFYHGHLYVFDYARNLRRLAPASDSYGRRFMDAIPILPPWLRAWYGYGTEYRYAPPWNNNRTLLRQIKQITMLRRPQDRLASMYYYDRHDARDAQWRTDLVHHPTSGRGNVTLESCLLDDACIERNQLARWCSVQTEMICGHPCARNRTIASHNNNNNNNSRNGSRITAEALELAKANLRLRKEDGDGDDGDGDGEKNRGSAVVFAGIVERMPESLRLLEQLFPTYLEGLGRHLASGSSFSSSSDYAEIPHEKKGTASKRRERSFSAEAQAKLDVLCRFDNELYDFADQLLTERMRSCFP